MSFVGAKVRTKGDRVVDVGDEVSQVTTILRPVRMERCRRLHDDRSEQIRTRKHERVASERHLDSPRRFIACEPPGVWKVSNRGDRLTNGSAGK